MMRISASIYSIPPEVTEHALILSEPRDVASFAQTCRMARAIVYQASDQHLWRKLFLEYPFDDPRRAGNPGTSGGEKCTTDWRNELQRRVYARRVLQRICEHPPELGDALETLVSVVKTAPSMGEGKKESHDLRWLSTITQESGAFKSIIDTSEWLENEQQLLAQLWCYIGWRDVGKEKLRADITAARNQARSFVYDMRNYVRESMWGPFLPDRTGRVNWKHVQAIITVVQANLIDIGRAWSGTRPIETVDSLRAYSAPGSHKRESRDWAGVEGHWRRYVCFMDYRDLFAYNFSGDGHQLSFFDNDEFQEATRLTELQLNITRITESSPSSSHTLQSKLPILHFSGTSRGGHGHEAKVNGTVRMMLDGTIRWKFERKASIHDHQHWSSEGVQIGNVGSAAGVVGTWTGAHHEDGDPAGPYWLWKVEDNHPSHLFHIHI